MITRRSAFRLGFGAATILAVPAFPRLTAAAPAATPHLGLRGAIDAGQEGVIPGGGDAAARKLASVIRSAAKQNMPVFLPPGTYEIGDLDLPDGSRLHGVAGARGWSYPVADGSPGRRMPGASRCPVSSLTVAAWRSAMIGRRFFPSAASKTLRSTIAISSDRAVRGSGPSVAAGGSSAAAFPLLPNTRSWRSTVRGLRFQAIASATAAMAVFSCIAGKRAPTARSFPATGSNGRVPAMAAPGNMAMRSTSTAPMA